MANKNNKKTSFTKTVAIKKPAYDQPKPIKKKVKHIGQGIAITGMVMTFFVALVGLILGAIGLDKGRKNKDRYITNLGIASVVLSSIFLPFEIYGVIYYLINGTIY